jgi:hypothetical protein
MERTLYQLSVLVAGASIGLLLISTSLVGNEKFRSSEVREFGSLQQSSFSPNH